jgi:sulfide:quinone oxidoreductase
MGQALKQIIEGRGIAFHPQHKLASVDVKQRELVFEQGNRAAFDLLLAVPVHHSPRVVQEAGLTGETGWIPVDSRTLKSRFEGVYAVGDGTGIRLPGRHRPDVPLSLPKAGAFAHLQAEVVAHNVAAEITGAGAQREFGGKGYCFVELEHGLAAFAQGSFYIEPAPLVSMTRPSRRGYWGKMLFEKYWLWRWFPNSLEPIKAALDKALVMNTRLWRWF